MVFVDCQTSLYSALSVRTVHGSMDRSGRANFLMDAVQPGSETEFVLRPAATSNLVCVHLHMPLGIDAFSTCVPQQNFLQPCATTMSHSNRFEYINIPSRYYFIHIIYIHDFPGHPQKNLFHGLLWPLGFTSLFFLDVSGVFVRFAGSFLGAKHASGCVSRLETSRAPPKRRLSGGNVYAPAQRRPPVKREESRFAVT